MYEHPLYGLDSEPLITPLGQAPVWSSPVFVPTIRRKDQRLWGNGASVVRQAVNDRWGLGPVFDWNPDGAVYDFMPDVQGRFARHFPVTPVRPYGRDWPMSLDMGSGAMGNMNRIAMGGGGADFGVVPFGAAARFGASTDMPLPAAAPAAAPSSAKAALTDAGPGGFATKGPLSFIPSALRKAPGEADRGGNVAPTGAGRRMVDQAVAQVRTLAPRRPPPESSSSGTSVVMIAGAAVVALGIGVALGSWLKAGA